MAEHSACTNDADLNDKGELVQSFWNAVDQGSSRLQSIPKLIKKILQTEAWRRRMHKGRLFEHERFLDFLTTKPFAGCGYNPDQVEALIKDDPETLAMWRKAVAPGQGFRSDLANFVYNVNEVKTSKGNSRAYTLDRLSRESPGLYEAVCRGELSANRAAIKAGFRKPPNPFSQIKKLLPKLSDSERRQLKDLL